MPKTKAAIKESKLSKGDLRKLAALRKSLGDEIADEAFAKWHGQQKKGSSAKVDQNVTTIEEALAPHLSKMSFPRGGGYVIKRGRGRVIVSKL